MGQLTNNAETDLLFEEYIGVVNQAIDENRGDFYGKVITLWELLFGGQLMAFGVYECDASNPHSWYTVKLEKGRLELVQSAKDPKAKWTAKVPESYLNGVVDNPDDYIAHPLKLDLDWLRGRISPC